MKVIIIRHGQTDANFQKILQGSGVDWDLNATGVSQAQNAAIELKNYNIGEIFSSKMKRAKQTAQTIATSLGVKNTPINNLQEVCFGDAEGMPSDEVKEKYKDIYDIINDDNNPQSMTTSIPNGETRLQSLSRSLEALEVVKKTSKHQIVGVVTHGAIMYNLYDKFFGIKRRFENCEFFEIEL